MNERNFWLSSLKKRELIELFLFLQKEKIIYCDELNSDLSFRFGLELEFMKGNLEWIKERLREKFLIREGSRYHQWQLKVDTSIPNNKEYILEVVSPILENTKQSWYELEKVCQILNEQNVCISPLCGGHIHVDFNIFKEDATSVKRFLLFYALFEHILFRYRAGEYLNPRNGCMIFAKPLANYIKENLVFDFLRRGYSSRYLFEKISYEYKEKRSAIFYNENNNTLEFRFFNASLDPVVWQNNVNVLAHMINYCTNSSYDFLLIYSKLLFLNTRKITLSSSRKIYLKDALLFADLIFANDETLKGKLAFLKQYLKDFKESDDELDKVKCFTMMR